MCRILVVQFVTRLIRAEPPSFRFVRGQSTVLIANALVRRPQGQGEGQLQEDLVKNWPLVFIISHSGVSKLQDFLPSSSSLVKQLLVFTDGLTSRHPPPPGCRALQFGPCRLRRSTAMRLLPSQIVAFYTFSHQFYHYLVSPCEKIHTCSLNCSYVTSVCFSPVFCLLLPPPTPRALLPETAA